MNFRSQRDRNVDINLTPLIDVVFLLLIFFMVSTTFVEEKEIELSLPMSDSSSPKKKEKTIEVSVDEKGITYVDTVPLENTSVEAITAKLAKALQNESGSPRPILIIKADSGTRHQSVVDIMDAAQRVGLTRISFATLNRESP